MSSVIIICTRPQSSRLPGKVFMPVAGVPAIKHILNRLEGCGIPVVLAVPEGCHDYDFIYDYYVSKTEKIPAFGIFYGDPQSPLHRMAACLEKLGTVEWVVRITHDDILIDQETMLLLLKACMEEPECGYGISPSIANGAGVEIIHRENLLKAAQRISEPTEFVSYFVKREPFKKNVSIKPRETVRRPYRLTMDYYNDWLVLDTVLGRVGPNASLDEVCHYIDTHPQIMNWNRQPLVTFYTCVKNGESYLRQTMQSVLTNGGMDIEYIVVDDGSTDDTAVIVSEFANDPRVKLYKNAKSLGLASSSNIAINKASGKYIMRVDADDILLPHATALMIAKIEAESAGAVYSGFNEISATGQTLKYNIDPRSKHHAGCALFDHKMINEIRFTDGLQHFDGADLHKRISSRGMPISYIEQPCWMYRRHDKNLSNSDKAARIAVRRQLGLGDMTATSAIPLSVL